jgi:hypothetical protein
VDFLEQRHASGDSDVRPDIVCYDALINAYGWSDHVGRSLKCYSIYKKMVQLYESGCNVNVRPDIITCNSILNACSFEKVATDLKKGEIMDIVVQTLEDFQSRAPIFGRPNHITYSYVLQCIREHTTDPEKKTNLAEATFWQCARSGQVSVLVLTNLHKVLSWNRLSNLLGKALLSGKDDNLHFNFRLLPETWTRYAPSPKERRDSPSQKNGRRNDKRAEA